MEQVESELLSETQFIPITDSEDVTSVVEEEEFSCPVCYTDGAESGLVSPSRCTHRICLECYTNIATRAPSPTCPLCRTEYLRASPPAQLNSTPQPIPITTPPLRPLPRPMSPNMNSDVMSLLIHNELPAYSVNSIIVNTLADIERTQMILDLLNTVN